MRHASQTEFGRPASACPGTIDDRTVDKWHIFDRLTVASRRLGLGHRTLAVLRGLLTFLPGREIPTDPVRATVFPANNTLSERLHGMPESTLRRHLAALIGAGLIARRDSPNRKRYVRRVADDLRLAFGFDLTALRLHAAAIEASAQDVEREAEEHRVLREEIRVTRAILLAGPRDEAATALAVSTAVHLRRRLTTEMLVRLRDTLRALLPERSPITDETSGSDRRNERHIQASSEPGSVESGECGRANEMRPTATEISVEEVAKNCSDAVALFGYPKTWDAVRSIADRAAPMIGIDLATYSEACRLMGADAAATATLSILQRQQHVRSPGAYLRTLARRSAEGRLDVKRLTTPARKPQLSADNRDRRYGTRI